MRSATIVLVAFVSILQTLTPQTLQAKTFEESQVKAVFLFNLTKFMRWPEKNRQVDEKRFCIGVLGKDPFHGYLEEAVKNETVKDRKIAIRYFDKTKEIDWKNVDLLFVGSEYVKDIPLLVEYSRKSNILTVGDVGGFCQFGGMVNLLREGRRVRVEINTDEIRKSGIWVSAKILKLARIINRSENIWQ